MYFFFYKFFKELENFVVIGDAIGLGTFTIIGIEKAFSSYMNILSSIIMGIITPTFGGIIRDVLANRVPFVLKREIYLSLCILGGVLFFVFKNIFLFNNGLVYFIVIVFITGLRILS